MLYFTPKANDNLISLETNKLKETKQAHPVFYRRAKFLFQPKGHHGFLFLQQLLETFFTLYAGDPIYYS